MTKTIVTIVGITSGALFFLYLYRMSKLGKKKDLNITLDNNPLLISDDSRETIIGGSRKRKKGKKCSKKYLKNN